MITTFYPDAHVESSSVDGDARGSLTSGQTWTTIRNSAGTGTPSGDSSVNLWIAYLQADVVAGWDDMMRSIVLFDINAIDSGDTITAATISLYEADGVTSNSFGGNVAIVASSPATDTAVIVADFTTLSTTTFASLAFGSIAGGYNDMVVNASGLTNLTSAKDGDGIVRWGGRTSWDADNDEPGFSSDGRDYWRVESADNADTTTDPKLAITHSSPRGAASSRGGASGRALASSRNSASNRVAI